VNATQGLLPGTVLGGRYRVEGALGQGGMGAVYLVRHVRTEERLALKLIHAAIAGSPELVERFRREARAPAQIDSDHVVRVVDADIAPEIGGAPFLVMEFLRGRDLEQELRARGRLPPPEVVGYLGQAARALDKAHRLGIVHRDLKPENLFLSERDDRSVVLKVLDFGIAKLGGDGSQATATGSMLGTPLYMSPEQAQGARGAVGPTTDVWALGLIAFRLLTGEMYWRFESGPDLLLKIVAAPMTPPSALVPWLGPGFDAWFARCCARAPAHRFASAGEAVQALAVTLGVAAPASGPMGHALQGPTAFAPTAFAGMSGAPPAAPPGAPATTLPSPQPGMSKRTLVLLAAAGAGLFTILVVVVLLAVVLPARESTPAETARKPAPTAEPAPAPSPTASAPPAPSAPANDACRAACARLARCTNIQDPTCESGCADSPTFAACVRSANGCPQVSACGLASYCNGMGPVGSRTCRRTAECEGRCVRAGGDNSGCICACVHDMAPEHANFLMMNNECATVHCPDVCGRTMNGPGCVACFDRMCLSEAAMCRAH
jgi:hypothetical protein